MMPPPGAFLFLEAEKAIGLESAYKNKNASGSAAASLLFFAGPPKRDHERQRIIPDEKREAVQDNTLVYQRIGRVSQFIHHFSLALKEFPSIFPQWAYWLRLF